MFKIKEGNLMHTMFERELSTTNILKLFMGLTIYFAIINFMIYFQRGTAYTRREWLLNPIINLIVYPNLSAWIVLILCEIGVWFFFEKQYQ